MVAIEVSRPSAPIAISRPQVEASISTAFSGTNASASDDNSGIVLLSRQSARNTSANTGTGTRAAPGLTPCRVKY